MNVTNCNIFEDRDPLNLWPLGAVKVLQIARFVRIAITLKKVRKQFYTVIAP